VDVQTILVCLAALAAVAYLGRGLWRIWAGKGCGSGCGSCGSGAAKKAPASLIPPEDLLLRAQKADRAGP
jgi:hypothetical protein